MKYKTYILNNELIDKYLYKNISLEKACFNALKSKNINVDIYNILEVKSFKKSYHIKIFKS